METNKLSSCLNESLLFSFFGRVRIVVQILLSSVENTKAGCDFGVGAGTLIMSVRAAG